MFGDASINAGSLGVGVAGGVGSAIDIIPAASTFISLGVVTAIVVILAGSASGVEGGVGIGADTAIDVGTAGSFDVGFASPASDVEGGVGIAVSLVGFAISLGVIGLGGEGNAGSFASRLATPAGFFLW